MTNRCNRPKLALPKGWSRRVRSAVLHAVALAHYAIIAARSSAAGSRQRTLRRAGESDRLQQEIALLREQLRIVNLRIARVPPHRRPHYAPVERMAIVQLRAARGWSLRQTAEAFQVAPATVASWHGRLEEQGPHALVQLREPVNKFPELVRHLVRQLKTLCPSLGKVKIAQVLARAGLHLAPSTVQRMLRDAPARPPQPQSQAAPRAIVARRPNHLWHVDLTTVPTFGGLWTAWLPFALPQRWPFCWWLAVAVDHYSRRALGVSIYKQQPASTHVRPFLARLMTDAGAAPKYLVCDKGPQFCCAGFKSWCKKENIRPRFGAVGKQGSIAVIERFIRTMKTECTRRLLVPLRREPLRRELALFLDWFNRHRPHAALAGRTPEELYYKMPPADRRARFEPRPRWPRASPSAAPRTLVKGTPGVRVKLDVRYLGGRKHLPLVTLRRVA